MLDNRSFIRNRFFGNKPSGTVIQAEPLLSAEDTIVIKNFKNRGVWQKKYFYDPLRDGKNWFK